jgi:hypothetical protein
MAHQATTSQDRRSQAHAIRSVLDDAAAMVNAQYATVLSSVIEAFQANLHREVDGFSAQRDWMISQFDFTFSAASDIASVAKLSGKFALLADAALTCYARIDQVAYAMRQLNKTPAAALFARTPFREAVPSPFDASVKCATPEALVTEYAACASYKELRRHLAELHANLAEEAELLDGLGEASLQRLELQELDNGMWALDAVLSSTTGALLDKYLKTACPPPRQDETDQHGVLPPAANRNAEALHQLLAGYGTSPEAATRHGHTATLDLVVDIETLQGKETGRVPLLEGRPVSVAQARLLACEAGVIPSVFNYDTGEAIELGRAARLPNQALRRKLELEQPGGCAWQGCDRPVAWTEAHHIAHWADGGETTAENLILLCRFHHGRIHTANWTVKKTGPGKALIVHHDHSVGNANEEQAGTHREPGQECGCADWRTEADLDANEPADFFPTGLYTSEWSERMRPDLEAKVAQVNEAKAYFEGGAAEYMPVGKSIRFDEVEPIIIELGKLAPPPPVYGDRHSAEQLIPFLASPQRATAEGSAGQASAARFPRGTGPLSMSTAQSSPTAACSRVSRTAEERPQPRTHLVVAASRTAARPDLKAEVPATETGTSLSPPQQPLAAPT